MFSNLLKEVYTLNFTSFIFIVSKGFSTSGLLCYNQDLQDKYIKQGKVAKESMLIKRAIRKLPVACLALIDIRIKSRIFIDIDLQWALIEGVLYNASFKRNKTVVTN